MPPWVLSRAQAAESLKDGTRSATSVRSHRWNRALVVVEVALACTLLLASALLVRRVTRLMQAPVGVSADDVLTASLQLSGDRYRRWPAVEQFYASLLEALRRQPGVDVAGVANALPLRIGGRVPFGVDGHPRHGPARRRWRRSSR